MPTKRKTRTETICAISVDDGMGEAKCGRCNWSASTFYYFKSDGVPKPDKNDEGRLTHGICAQCMMDCLDGKKVIL